MNEFEKRYKSLNPAQQKAVDTIDGPVMVVAGPGTGKTELMSMRVAQILQKTDTNPENILCLTYTDSGAAAMRERLVEIIGLGGYKVAVHTFHSFGSEIINQYREHFYRGAVFQPADDLKQLELLQSILSELPLDNPLASTMNGQFTYLSDVKSVISELKRSGLTSEQLLEVLSDAQEDVDHLESLLKDIFINRVSAKIIPKLEQTMGDMASYSSSRDARFEIMPLAQVATSSLQQALSEAKASGKTPAISAWKKQWFTGSKDTFELKARDQVKKLRAVSSIYFSYLSRMEQAGLYDYDDMILQVVQQLETNDDLRFNLQEKYLYISIDEFQDTNLAQMRIVHSLTSHPANEGKPNILVVGDDDQAIYSFQGADISNILNFVDHFPATKVVTLTQNYRSTEPVLLNARQVIVQGSDRLEQTLENVNKQLTANNKNSGKVNLYEAATSHSERQWLVESIAEQIRSGVEPNDIAVFMRQHTELKQLLPYFEAASIPVSYEYQDDALGLPPIKALLTLARVVVSLAKGRHDVANAHLPELLAHPAWNLAANDIWKLSVAAFENSQHWLSVMANDPAWQPIHEWLITLSRDSLTLPAEAMVDRLIGKSEENTGPFYDYYFSTKALQKHPQQYIQFLSALTTVRQHLYNYSPNQQLSLSEFIDFIELNLKFGRSIKITQQLGSANGVQLMTAHKSKGLEFPHVYIANCVDNVWGDKARAKNRLISYPANMPLAVAGNTSSERLRLLYVALTRAKTNLNISYSKLNDNNKPTLMASFLTSTSLKPKPVEVVQNELSLKATELSWNQHLALPSPELKDILKPIIKDYKLSPTHLCHFLDITKGGPQQFMLERLLRFPSTTSVNAAYGSAIHTTMQNLHGIYINQLQLPPLEDVFLIFENALKAQRLSSDDFAQLLQRGHDHLRIYLQERSDHFSKTQQSEITFSNQEVILGQARLTGKIDLIDIDKEQKTVVVTDYKTAKPSTSWKGNSSTQQIQFHHYHQQLLFYKLLIDGSRDYSTYDVSAAQLDFIRPNSRGYIEPPLQAVISPDNMDRLTALVEKVWQHIQDQNFPDTSNYDPSLRGVLAFEQDLIDGVI